MIADINQLFREITVRVCGNFHLGEALGNCLAHIQPVIPANVWAMSVVEMALAAIRLMAVATEEGSLPVNESTLIPLSRESRDFILSKQPGKAYIFNRGREAVPTVQTAAWFGVDQEFSTMNMKLAVGGEVIGSTMMAAVGHDRFTEEHARILESLNEPLAIALSNARRYREIMRLQDTIMEDNRALQKDLLGIGGGEMIGAGGGLRLVSQMIEQVAPLDSPVLLLGGTGVGKEIVANEIHRISRRRDGPLIKLNCGAIPENLIDSELFGHEKGAFTGAVGQKRGRFERAHKGTLFLDEIGELPMSAQIRFLRVLQHMEIERVGGSRPIPVDVRILAATHRDLEQMVRDGRFREDLWYRLHVFPIVIPPLREHAQDIPALTDHFLKVKAREMNLPTVPTLAPGAMDQLLAYDWPGNVRELQNVIERALILHRGQPLEFSGLRISSGKDLPPADPSRAEPIPTLDRVMEDHIRHVLEVAGGRIEGKGGAAEILGVQHNTLRARMKKLGIPFGHKARR